MNARSPFLTEPICALIGADGRLLSADPELMQLHLRAGGVEAGVFAIPKLRAMAALAYESGMHLERAVTVADDENVIDLWVSAAMAGDDIVLSISGWHEKPSERVQSLGPALHNDADEILQLDSGLAVIRAPVWLVTSDGHGAIGEHFANLVGLINPGNGDMPLLDLLAERIAIENLAVRVAGNINNARLSLRPVVDPNQAFLGYSGRIFRAMNHDTPGKIDAALPDSVGQAFGGQLAPILRQPLSRIIANAETIGARLKGPLRENYVDYAQDIVNAARHLTELVSDIEDLAAIDRPDFVTAQDEVDLGDIARRVAGLLALKAADHQIHLTTPPEQPAIVARAEFRRILQIVLNLVTNAIRYAPDGTNVSLTVAAAGDLAHLCVIDEGQGIAGEDRERIFEKFERLGRSGDGGSGLGLYISRKLARAMGGDLYVTPHAGHGACFTLSLPRNA